MPFLGFVHMWRYLEQLWERKLEIFWTRQFFLDLYWFFGLRNGCSGDNFGAAGSLGSWSMAVARSDVMAEKLQQGLEDKKTTHSHFYRIFKLYLALGKKGRNGLDVSTLPGTRFGSISARLQVSLGERDAWRLERDFLPRYSSVFCAIVSSPFLFSLLVIYSCLSVCRTILSPPLTLSPST